MMQQSVAAVVAGAKIGPSETEKEKEGGKALIAFLKVRNKWELEGRRESRQKGLTC